MAKKLYELKLHEESNVDSDCIARRVPGGWIYVFYCSDGEIVSSNFVPYHAEFALGDDSCNLYP